MPFRRGRVINHGVYDSDRWWQPDSALYLLGTSVNPARIDYFKRKLLDDLDFDPVGKQSLEVGCGGGILSEELAALGFRVTGIDPSDGALNTARAHSLKRGLDIRYEQAAGEAIPFGDHTFDAVFCCDVLEHVDDLGRVISEIGRVLKPGGCFCYDTVNRSWLSWLIAIKVAQQWRRWAFLPENLHSFAMFIKPEELTALLHLHSMQWREHRGLKPNLSYLQILRDLRLRVTGKLSYAELGERVRLVETDNLNLLYMGYAVKEAQ